MEKTHEKITDATLQDEVLLCPECNGNNLHQQSINILNINHYVIKFTCEYEHTHNTLPQLHIKQHKGCTLIEWKKNKIK